MVSDAVHVTVKGDCKFTGGCKKLLASLQRSAGRGLALASSVRGQRWSATLPHLRTERWFPQDQHLPYYMLGNYVLHCLQLFFLFFFSSGNSVITCLKAVVGWPCSEAQCKPIQLLES